MSLTADENRDIETAIAQESLTRRASAPHLEKILYQVIPVLDHGFIRVIDYLGNDAAILQAARVSYGTGTRRASDDRTLIRYLMRNRHTTPFEMAEIKLHVKLPIFVARQWIRHRTASVNEYSARYSILSREFYIPSYDAIATQSEINKQGRGDALSESEAAQIVEKLRDDAQNSYEHYLWIMNAESDPSRRGASRELARIGLPLNTYTEWYWKIDLHNLLRFVQLRLDPHAQFEIRAYADEILKVIKHWVPLTFEAFLDYQFNGLTLSAGALAVIRKLLAGENASDELAALSKREREELSSALGRQI